ncbi:hypothetical protein [Streptomyces sp. NBC_01294]|uniref:hypothetical protein n=1 Tax=Streptomyces sp. NBC_01294 TaxID=2903815 RepID=UPI002DD8B6B9|nr:hypothetical protein [Streptomyces sp. NBC_01294]WRZ58877.1 hypothetical protein OG534_21720 [Streptomyces sp. NBC_01294]
MCREPDTIGAGTTTEGGGGEICPDGLQYYAQSLRGRAPSGPCPPCLLDLGLVRRLPDGSFVPVPPRLAAGEHVDRLERAIEEKRNALQAVRSSISRAQEVYLDSYARTDAHPVRALYGAGTIAAALSAAVHACRDELLTAQPGGARPQDLSTG